MKKYYKAPLTLIFMTFLILPLWSFPTADGGDKTISSNYDLTIQSDNLVLSMAPFIHQLNVDNPEDALKGANNNLIKLHTDRYSKTDTIIRELDQSRDPYDWYKGWVGDPDSVTVYIDPNFTPAQKAEIQTAIDRWNNEGCVPALKTVTTSPANVNIKRNDALGGGGKCTLYGNPATGEVSRAEIEIDTDGELGYENTSVGELTTHELGHALGLDHTNNAADVMKPKGSNGNNGALSAEDKRELQRAGAQAVAYVPPDKSEAPAKAMAPGESQIVSFELVDYYPPEILLQTNAEVYPFYDPQLFVDFAEIDFTILNIGVTSDITHPNSTMYLMVELFPPAPYEPVSFLGYHFIHADPVDPVAFECPFEVLQEGENVYVNWTDMCTYPFENNLRSELVIDGDIRCLVKEQENYPIQLSPGMHTLELTVDDFQVNRASYSMDIFVEATTPPWEEPFEDYPLGSDIVGQGGWEFWFGGTSSPSARVTDTHVHTGEQALKIMGTEDQTGDDIVHQFSGCTSGIWEISARQYIPEEATGGTTYFVLLNQYGNTLEECNWSTQIKFDPDLMVVQSEGDGESLPLIKGEWAEIRVVIDLDIDMQTIYYNNNLLISESWTTGTPQAEPGILNIAAIDLWSNNLANTPVYYDDMSLMPYEPPVPSGVLKVGDWLKSEEWHRWIGNDTNETKVEFYPEQSEGILYVDFYFSIAGTGEWVFFDSDNDGVTGLAPGPLPDGSDEFDGWSGYLDHALLPDVNVELDFRADVFTVDSFFDVFTELSIKWDVTPPSAVTTNLFDFYSTDDPYILLEVLPESANITTIEIAVEPKPEYFEKGIPPAQQPGGMDCGPTALAACLKYFESNGHPNVTGGYSLEELIEWLKNYCKTDPEKGTWDTDLEKGALDWINDHGGGFTVRRIGFDWQTMRNELERCQDVITLFTWDGGGHFMTFNSVSNVPEPDGRIKFDFMDPWTGENIDGYLNPETGAVDGLTDSQGNIIVPDGAEIFSNIIICPEESDITPGTGTIIPWPIPQPYPIPIDSSGLWWIRLQIIDEDGNKSRLDYPIEVLSQVEPGVDDLNLKIGDWLVAEPWHDWIGGMNAESTVELLASDPDHLIQKVSFFYSMDGGQEFLEFCTDTDGSQPALSTYGEAGDGDGWACQFPHEMLPAVDMELFFRAEVTLTNGEVLTAENSTVFDPNPPNEVIINLEDWLIFEDDQILLQVDPGNCIDLDRVWFDLVPKVDSFAKGIPLIYQRTHSDTHCSPTASAACLKYFESKGDSTIAGGLNDYDLVEALAGIMKTNQGKSGTYISDIANGLKTWAKNHGDNYTVRKLPYNWKTMRDELERCQDVIPSIFWPGGGGHSMTFNSIVNTPNADGTITVDFMDPWTGQIEWGHINPATGKVTQLSGAGGGGSGEMGPMIIVCPKDPSALPGNGHIIPGPFPNPGIIIPVPNPGLYYLRIIFIDNSMHVARTDLVLKRESTMDWGDAPDDTTSLSYPTLAINNGASHFMDGITFLGSLIDGEPDGQPNANATGDDLNNLADEDGISFGPIKSGCPAQITVVASVKGYLQGWMDFNGDGDWNDANEQIFTDEYIHFPLTVCLNYMVPVDAVEGNTFARFRFASFPGLPYDGSADNGEVEDYMVNIVHDQGIKWQQEPCPENSGLHCHDYIEDGTYLYTVIADDWMCNGGLVTDIHWWGNYENMGSGIDHFHLSIHNNDPTSCLPVANEIWGMDVTMDMVNETNTGVLNKENKFIYSYEYYLDIPFDQVEGQTYWLDICAYSVEPANPAVWRWQESDRSIVPILCAAASKSQSSPWSSLYWTIPQEPTRYSDMAFAITSEGPPPDNLDFGDAPDDPYPTLLANNGARHIIDGITYLGEAIDPESDGQPNIPATGDDLANVADEDGVVFRTPLVQGKAATIKVLASVDGILNVWLDIDRNNTWADAADHVFVNKNLVAGWNTLTLNVPASAVIGKTYMRFRFDSQGGLSYYGLAENGEVEDYLVKILPEGFGYIPTPSTHTILVPLNVVLSGTSLSANDAVGVFYQDNGVEVCGGAELWDGVNNQVVIAYGNDNTTTEKDGFDDGDLLVWKIHHTSAGTDEYVTVAYDASMPQSDGLFATNGLSALTQINGLSVTAAASPTAVCAGNVVQLDAIVSGGSGSPAYLWSSNPPGFTANIKNPTDTPTQDITYIVEVTDGGATATASVDVVVQALPTADAGIGATICEDDSHQLDGTVVNSSSILWSSAGDGVFDNKFIEDPVYLPGPTDILSGSVSLTIEALPVNPCLVSAFDDMMLTIALNPIASAGQDVTICESDDVLLAGSATNYSGILWTSSGDGSFDDPTSLNPTYTPGSNDISDASVDLSITAYPKLPCTDSVTAVMSVTIIHLPTVDAGGDASVCQSDSITLTGSATAYSSVLWSVIGDGVFDDATNLVTTYTPGSNDIQLGSVTICLMALPVNPCQLNAEDCITLYILEEQNVYLFKGWNGLSSYLTPYNSSDNDELFSPILNNLIVTYNFDGAFWPGNSNSLNWVDTSGYIVKLSVDDEMIFCGEEISDKVLNLKQDWNLIPVLSETDVDVTQVFDASVDFKIVLEVAGWKIYWPDYLINSIINLETGKSYFVFMNSAGSIDYTNASNKSGLQENLEFVNRSPWDEGNNYPGGHAIAFAPEVLGNFTIGDVIGGFTSSGLCAGMANYDGNALGIILNGDDVYTLSVDGYQDDEAIILRVFRPVTQELFDLEVEYDDALDATGRFHNFSLSAVNNVKLSPVGISNYNNTQIRIYPNPSHGIFNLEGIEGEVWIYIYNSFGDEVYKQTISHSAIINLSEQQKGIYLTKIQTLNGTHYQKLIIN